MSDFLEDAWALVPDWLQLLIIVMVIAVPVAWVLSVKIENWFWTYEGPGQEGEENESEREG